LAAKSSQIIGRNKVSSLTHGHYSIAGLSKTISFVGKITFDPNTAKKLEKG
jgi:hypothetical protein